MNANTFSILVLLMLVVMNSYYIRQNKVEIHRVQIEQQLTTQWNDHE